MSRRAGIVLLVGLVGCPSSDPVTSDASNDASNDASGDGVSCVDSDGDSFGAGCADPDCDDSDPNIHPGATEACNGDDDDCDTSVDESIALLSCGTGACAVSAAGCVAGSPGTCTAGTPGTETCNNVDDDCNGTPDDPAPLECGTGECAVTTPACVGGAAAVCTPGMPATEVCGNGLDEDCSGSDLLAPANLTCSSPAVITVGSTIMGDNTCSGADLAPAVMGDCAAGDGAGNEATYTLASDGSPKSYTIQMTGASGYDTLLHAHASNACAAADQLACADDVPAVNASAVTVNGLPSGGLYYLVADSANTTNNGPFTLTTTSAAINNDTCTTPAPIRDNGTFNGTTTGRTNNYLPPAGCSASTPSASADVVYRVTARANVSITATTAGSTFDTLLWVTATCGTGSITCSDDASGLGSQSSITWSATAGTTYYLVISGFDAVAQGSYVLNISGF